MMGDLISHCPEDGSASGRPDALPRQKMGLTSPNEHRKAQLTDLNDASGIRMVRNGRFHDLLDERCEWHARWQWKGKGRAVHPVRRALQPGRRPRLRRRRCASALPPRPRSRALTKRRSTSSSLIANPWDESAAPKRLPSWPCTWAAMRPPTLQAVCMSSTAV